MRTTHGEANMDFSSNVQRSHREAIVEHWKDAFAQYGCEKLAAFKVFDSLPVSIKEQSINIYQKVNYNRRRHGRADFFCWPTHTIFEKDLIDPWPASRYPKSVLLLEIAKGIVD